jgi:lysine-specific demethylase 3
LCIACCRELRQGKIPGGEDLEIEQYEDRGKEYVFGRIPNSRNRDKRVPFKRHKDTDKTVVPWKANSDGSIPCPPKEKGGCGGSHLDLKFLQTETILSELEDRADKLVRSGTFKEGVANASDRCPCSDHSDKRTQAANRDGSGDNYLYSPIAEDIQDDDLVHFQKHWAEGEPVIVSDVLRLTAGLSWEPSVMVRALRERKTANLAVEALDCLDLCEVRTSTLLYDGSTIWTINCFYTCILCSCEQSMLLAMFPIGSNFSFRGSSFVALF